LKNVFGAVFGLNETFPASSALITGIGLTTDSVAAFEGARLGCGFVTAICNTPGVEAMLAGMTPTICVDEMYCVGTGLPFTRTVAKSRRLFGFCEKFVPVMVTCTGGAFNATGAVIELGEIFEITGIG